MTAYEIISIFIGILALLMSFGSLVIALLAFLDKRNKRKQKYPPCWHQDGRLLIKRKARFGKLHLLEWGS